MSVSAIVSAATTIGTNISTGGTLTVTGASSLTGALTMAGNASTTGSAVIKSATINSDTGAISFGNENLTTTGTLTVSGILTIDTNTLYVDATNNRVGIGSTSPDVLLMVGSTTPTTVSGYRDAFFAGAEEMDGVLTLDANASTTGSAVLKSATINSDTGAITFTNENLSTTGTLAAGATTITGALSVSTDIAMATASSTGIVKFATINSDTGAISFSNENLTTTGAINFATASSTGLATLDSIKVSSTGTTVAGLLHGTCSINPASIAAATSSPISCSATGVVSGDKVFVTPPPSAASVNSDWLIFSGASASTTAANIQIELFNASTTAAIDGPAETWTWMAIR